MNVQLIDQSDYQAEPLNIEVSQFNGTVLIKAEGYGEKCSDAEESHPVVIELYEGKLRVIAWADINQEDPTHIIDLSGAKEENRLDNDQ